MIVTFVFKSPDQTLKSTIVEKEWGNNRPLPNVGDWITHKDDDNTGVVKRIEWDLDNLRAVRFIVV